MRPCTFHHLCSLPATSGDEERGAKKGVGETAGRNVQKTRTAVGHHLTRFLAKQRLDVSPLSFSPLFPPIQKLNDLFSLVQFRQVLVPPLPLTVPHRLRNPCPAPSAAPQVRVGIARNKQQPSPCSASWTGTGVPHRAVVAPRGADRLSCLSRCQTPLISTDGL